MTTTMTMTNEFVETNTTDVPDEAAHIVLVPAHEDDQSPQAYVMRARVEGFPIVALCGHTFIPAKDPKPLPVCSPCLDIYEHDPQGHGDRDQLPEA